MPACVCVCLRTWVCVEECKPGVGCCCCIWFFVALCEAGSTLWGSPPGPRQCQCRIIHPGTKCVITMRKPAAPAPSPRTARPAGEVGRHSLAARRRWKQAHTHRLTRAHRGTQRVKMHIVTRMAIVIHAHVRTHAICSSCAGMESAFSKKSAVASCCCQEINIVCFYESFCREQNNIEGALNLYNLENVKKCEFITEFCIFLIKYTHLMEFNIFQLFNNFFFLSHLRMSNCYSAVLLNHTYTHACLTKIIRHSRTG